MVSALGAESDNPGTSPSRGKVLCALETCGEKKMQAPLLGLAKSIYYCLWGMKQHLATIVEQPKQRAGFELGFDH